jgi:dCMP deaminase
MNLLNRMDEHEMFMQIAELIARRSTCCRKQVGAIIVNEGKIISTGYNGVPKGKNHCNEHFIKKLLAEKPKDKLVSDSDYVEYNFENFMRQPNFMEEHLNFSNKYELHAEMNALLFAEKRYLENSTLYSTLSPCINCSKLIISAKIKKVYYRTLYDRDGQGEALDILMQNDIEIIKI